MCLEMALLIVSVNYNVCAVKNVLWGIGLINSK